MRQRAEWASAANGTKITRIYARGDVVINSDQDQTTTGDLADYDVPGQMVTVSGNVVLTQGKNVLKGDRLVINLTTGESRFDHEGNSAARRRASRQFSRSRKPPLATMLEEGQTG